MKFGYLGILAVVLTSSACSPSSPEERAGNSGSVLQHDFTLSQAEFDALAPETQFMVANKALSTMYRGLPADEFFDLTQGLDEPVVQYSNFVADIQTKLQEPLSSTQIAEQERILKGVEDDPSTEVDEEVRALFRLDSRQNHQAYMGRIQSYPLSHDFFVSWMSYFLANTIMFSPAQEMESVQWEDTASVFRHLKTSMIAKAPIRDVIRGWLNNLSRWRVSRSPENHALEMFELYLGKFNDTEEDQLNTLNGGKVCSDRYLSDDDQRYALLSVDGHIPETVRVFDQYISSCEELYDVVAGHPLVIPRVTEVIVNYFLDGSSSEVKSQLINNIVATGPVSFDDIFLPVIFSKEFLLNSERPKTFEENAFNFLHAMHWTSRAESGELDDEMMDRLLDYNRFDGGADIGVHRMGWASTAYKIGRTPFLPMDVLSFATYHKAIREEVLMNQRAYDGCYHLGLDENGSNGHQCWRNLSDEEISTALSEKKWQVKNGGLYVAGTENLKTELEGLTAKDRRNHLRVDEDGIIQLEKTDGDRYWEDRADDFAEVVLDYISRLPEFYYYKAAN